MKAFARIAAFMLALPAVAGAAGAIDGTWAGRNAKDDAAPLLVFALNTDGGTLTGSIRGAGQVLSIENGTASADALQFNAVDTANGGSVVAFSCSGALQEDVMTLTCQTPGEADRTFALKRQKAS